MSWLPKRDKLDPVQASAMDFAVAQEGKKQVELRGGGGQWCAHLKRKQLLLGAPLF